MLNVMLVERVGELARQVACGYMLEAGVPEIPNNFVR
jgi:hypothetical protein